MITISNLSIQYGGKFLFNDISFTITEKDRLGLVGKNGAGKSTMLKIICKEIVPEGGSVAMDNRVTLGYLPQDLELKPTMTVYEEAATAFSHLQSLQKKVLTLENEIANRIDYDSKQYFKLLQKLTDTQDQILALGGLNLREKIEKILKGLGFVNGDFDRPLQEFSGGWQMRVELAKILLRQPDYILLDEPTNHLDIESIMWLEDFLLNYSGGVLLISHDKAFLDHVSNRTIEIVNGKVYDYRTSYSKFVELRKERQEKQITAAKRQAKEIEHTQELINKFRAKKNKAAFAQTLIRKLENTERLEVDDLEKSGISFRFPDAPRSGKVVLNIEGLSKSYGVHEILRNVNFSLERGEKIAFVGKNGEGKTTLTKIITGKESYGGKLEIGYNVSIGYYEQHQAETLNGDKTVFQTIDDVATGDMRLRVRSLLGAFLFSGDDADKKVQVLSGGEKSRLALARMLLNPVNLLILDEPTNHLDMQAKNILKQAVKNFNGTVIIVSHDREFLEGLTDKVYEFTQKNVKSYFGDIYDFLEAKNMSSLDDLGMNTRKALVQKSALEEKQDRIRKHEETKALEKEIRKISNRVSKSEKRIDELEQQIETWNNEMAKPDFYSSHKDPNSVMNDYNKAKKDLEKEMENWENYTLELEELREKQIE